MLVGRRRLVLAVVLVIAGIAFAGPLSGYYFDNKVLWNGPVTMQLQLGPSGPLADGSAGWDQSAAEALELWNQFLKSPVQFRFVRGSMAPIRKNDKNNNVFFADDVFGEPFPAGTAAITLLRWSGSTMSDADVVFNRAFPYDSYRGPNQGAVLDFRRVALHEFGHVLGLDHPDAAGQSVSAIMNSVVSDADALQPDDVEGVASIYGHVEARSIGTTVRARATPHEAASLIGFPAREDIARFGAALEARSRAERRPVTLTFVDTASAAIWTQEYIRYRVQACSHADAMERTVMQMEGLGIQPVCGMVVEADLPPHNDLFDFRAQLETTFRDDFKTRSGETHVGAPADAAWIQEYLRYRLGRCDHAEASARVFDQIAGRAAAPTCR